MPAFNPELTPAAPSGAACDDDWSLSVDLHLSSRFRPSAWPPRPIAAHRPAPSQVAAELAGVFALYWSRSCRFS